MVGFFQGLGLAVSNLQIFLLDLVICLSVHVNDLYKNVNRDASPVYLKYISKVIQSSSYIQQLTTSSPHLKTLWNCRNPPSALSQPISQTLTN